MVRYYNHLKISKQNRLRTNPMNPTNSMNPTNPMNPYTYSGFHNHSHNLNLSLNLNPRVP